MLDNNILCPKCGLSLHRHDNMYKCDNGHSYDTSKEGYLNLLLSKTNCGDLKDSVNCRKNFLEKGFYYPLVEFINNILIKYNSNNILDCGCGIGYYSKCLSDNYNIIGIDISKDAIKLASKHDKKSFYIVSSSASIPIRKNSFDAAYVIFAPLFEDSIANMLNNDGILIIVTPNVKHLYEIKEVLYKNPYLNETSELNLSLFTHINTDELTYKINLKTDDIINLIGMTPYLYKTNKEDLNKLNEINNLDVTIDFSIHTYKKTRA